MWSLGQTKDVEEAKRLLTTNVANEISARTVEPVAAPKTINKKTGE
jgi:hypothetical protein